MTTDKLIRCTAKHTKYQPSGDKWRCPKCGARAAEEHNQKGFHIVDWVDDADDMCDLLHEEDRCYCEVCGYEASGKTVARRLQRLDSMVPCPHCKGTGLVKEARDVDDGE